MKPNLSLLCFKNLDIFEQLQLEEALLRTSEESFCIINEGSKPAIVMGISNRPEELLDIELVKRDQIPVIQRFSGGGTVFVDEETLFVTFLIQKKTLSIPFFPQSILSWSTSFYQPIFNQQNFFLRENDFTLGEKKIAGNAKYIRQNAFLLHTSFLYDFNEENMRYLLLPKKRPAYRQNRSHHEFLTRLRGLFPSMTSFTSALIQELHCHFTLNAHHEKNIFSALSFPHRKTTTLLTF